MSHFQQSLTIEATPAAVYAALTTPDSLHGWWTEDADVATEAGDTTRVRFHGKQIQLRIDRLEAAREVLWSCTQDDMHVAKSGKGGEWIGTQIVFRLAPEGAARTRLHFEHVGLVPQLHCYSQCDRGWQFFQASLQQLVENGRGRPYTISGPLAATAG
jgi:uncharacterized protein YndB with AHSA1/START domain